jgi:DNA-binding LacI/PurR family transcriptional regulator
MADVARLAVVSHQTVSRVLNGHPSVRPETRAKVLAAIDQLGYRPNLTARALVTRRSHIIGLVVTDTRLSGITGGLVGVEEAARERGYWVSVAGLVEVGADDMARAISHFIDQGVDGIIVIATSQAVIDSALETVGSVPFLLLTVGAAPPGVLTADIDQAAGVRQAMDLLLGLGHRRIAHLAGPRGHFHADARDRAWRQALAQAGLGEGLRLQADWTAASGYRAAQTLLALEERPTAVVAANDLVALGLLRGFWEAGVTVPGEVSVVGFDDIDGTDQTTPPLTTVRQDFARLGARCVELLLARIEGLDQPCDLIEPQLVIRASTGRPPA